jgi:hypothetical protein
MDPGDERLLLAQADAKDPDMMLACVSAGRMNLEMSERGVHDSADAQPVPHPWAMRSPAG